jgi:regulator of protease activity HflC (stomatin/prohibitin superfamily)
MKKHMGMIILAVLVLGVFVTYTVAYSVDPTQWSLVTRFGRVLDDSVLNGSEPGQGGLKFKQPYPIESRKTFEARIMMFEDPDNEMETEDKIVVRATIYCAWRISDPVVFNREFSDVDRAMLSLRPMLQSAESDVISQYTMGDLINTDPALMQLEAIENDILAKLRADAEAPFGIEIVMVGIKALGLPETSTEKVIEKMKGERQLLIKSLLETGESRAQTIRAQANDASQRILAFATRRAKEISAEGYQQLDELYSQFSEAPELVIFLRSLESLETELADRTVFLLDGSMIPAVQFFREGPRLND